MASIASLTIDMALNTASFAASAKKVQADVSTMKETVEGFGESLETARGFLEKFGIALGVRELVEFGKQSVETAASIQEMAAQTGLTTAQFQGLQFAAASAGDDTETFVNAVARLTRSAGDAAAGNKKAIDSFNALGVGVLNSAGQLRAPADIFASVAKSIAAIPDPARRASLEVGLLGKSGQGVDDFIREFADGKLTIDQLAQAAKDAGFAFSDELIEGAKAAEGKIELLRREAEVFAVTWGSEFLKALEGTPNALDDALKGLQPLADFLNHLIDLENEYAKTHRSLLDILRGGADPNNPVLKPLTDAEAGLNGGLNPPKAAPSTGVGLGAIGAGHNPIDTSAADKIQAVIAALTLERDNFSRTAEEVAIYNDLQKAGVTLNSAAGQQIAALATQVANLKAGYEAETAIERLRVQALTAGDQALAASFKTQQQMADAAVQRQVDIKQEIDDNTALIAALQQGSKAYAEEVEFLKLANAARQAGQPLIGDEIEQARQQAATLVSQSKAMSDLQQNAADVQSAMEAVSGEFVNAATGVETWGDAAKAVLGDVLKLIAKILEQQLVLSFGQTSGGSGAGGIGGFFSGILGSVFSGLFGGGAGAFPGVPSGAHLATGGAVTAGMPYTVGEHGEEKFIPATDGWIMPHNFAGASGGGGVTITPYYDFRGSSVSQADVQRAVEQGNKKTYSAVFAAMNRGGPEAKASGRRAHR